jgi:dUTP pyrophosphatase
LRQAVQVYREIANLFPDFNLIECTRNGQMLSREEIGGMIWRAAAPKVGYFADDGRTAFRVMPGHFYSDTPSAEDKPKQALRVQRIHPQAKLPVRPHASDAGLDIFSADYYTVMPGQRVLVSTGIKMAIPEGYSGLIWDKSGLAKHGLITIGGVIDSGYRGEILVGLMNVSPDIFHIAPGQKVAQMVIQEISQPEIQEPFWTTKPAATRAVLAALGYFKLIARLTVLTIDFL